MHYKTLVQSSKQYEEEQDKAEVVERDEVDEALAEKLELARQFSQQLRGKQKLETLHASIYIVGFRSCMLEP